MRGTPIHGQESDTSHVRRAASSVRKPPRIDGLDLVASPGKPEETALSTPKPPLSTDGTSICPPVSTTQAQYLSLEQQDETYAERDIGNGKNTADNAATLSPTPICYSGHDRPNEDSGDMIDGNAGAAALPFSSPSFELGNNSDILVEDRDCATEADDYAMAVVPLDNAIHHPPPTQSPAEQAGKGVDFTALLTTLLETDAAAQREERANECPARATVRDRKELAARRRGAYIPRTLFCLSLDSLPRRTCFTMLEWAWFDRLMLAAIAANCIFMAMDDPPSQHEATAYNRMLFVAGAFFQGVFTFEATVKIIANGLLLGRGTYLRDWWNVMDFIVVFLGLLSYGVELGSSASVLRTFRLMRPLRALRAVGRFKDLRMMVNLIVSCIPLLVDVFTLVAFIFVVFGIVSIQVITVVAIY